jgi:hypothetical protein
VRGLHEARLRVVAAIPCLQSRGQFLAFARSLSKNGAGQLRIAGRVVVRSRATRRNIARIKFRCCVCDRNNLR